MKSADSSVQDSTAASGRKGDRTKNQRCTEKKASSEGDLLGTKVVREGSRFLPMFLPG